MSNITRRALEAYRAQLVTEFSASITALDAALAHIDIPDGSRAEKASKAVQAAREAAPVEQAVAHTPVIAEPYLPSPVAPPMPYVNPHIPEASQAPALQPQEFANGGYVDAAPEQPALVKVDGASDPWAVTGPHPAAPPPKKGRRTNEEIAAEYGVDLKDVVGTGKNGRVTHDDIKAAGEAKAATAAEPVQQFVPPQITTDEAGSAYVAGPAVSTVPEQPYVQVTPDQFAAFQAQQQAQQQLAWPQPEQPQAQPQAQQFVPPQAQAQQFVPPPALPEGFAPATFQQAY